MREHLVQAVSRRHTNDRRVHYLDKWCSLKISKGVSTHDTLKYCLDIIDNKSSMVKAVSRRRTHCRQVHYRDQWCSLKMSDTINCIFTHDTSSYYLGVIDNRSSLVQIVSRRHTHDQRVHYLILCRIDKKSTSVQTVSRRHIWSTGTLPEPMVFIKGVKQKESKGIFMIHQLDVIYI